MRKLSPPHLVRLIEWYQTHISPRIPGNQGACIYYPYELSCSEYAKQQFLHKPWWIAIMASGFRLLSCNPIHGYYRAWKRNHSRS